MHAATLGAVSVVITVEMSLYMYKVRVHLIKTAQRRMVRFLKMSLKLPSLGYTNISNAVLYWQEVIGRSQLKV